MLKLRPHHFMDVIKLYGRGIDVFVPDAAYHHDFYKVANTLIGHREALVTITLGADDICTPCRFLGNEGACRDGLGHIPGFASKQAWNDEIDRRICAFSGVDAGATLTAATYCQILYSIHTKIAAIWHEEPSATRQERHRFFCLGAEKYLSPARD